MSGRGCAGQHRARGGRCSYARSLAAAPAILDVIYHPWPTTLAAAAQRRGAVVVGGLDMLLNQAFTQVELFTGLSAPRAAMAAALH